MDGDGDDRIWSTSVGTPATGENARKGRHEYLTWNKEVWT
jgi:hypothetical protein